jgi:hypothetical protein
MEVALVALWWRFGGALVWLWVAYWLPIGCLANGFVVAL